MLLCLDSHLGALSAPESPRNFLKRYPDGAYSTALVRQGEIVDFELHVQRLSRNVSEMHQSGRFKGLTSEGSATTIASQVRAEFIRLLQQSNTQDVSTAVVVMVATDVYPESGIREDERMRKPLRMAIYVKSTSIEDLQDPIKVTVVGPGRFQPGIKDTNWITNRQQIADKVPQDASEGLLQDSQGRLLEGLVTNFCVVRSQKGTSQMLLETAPVGTVLEGTVRARVLAAAHMCGLRVQETPPDPRESDTWSEAFVCNALRLLQPVHQLECPSEDAEGQLGGWNVHLQEPDDSVLWKLRETVLTISHRTPVSELLDVTYVPAA